MIKIKLGDIYWINFSPTIGTEIRKIRPALIIFNSYENCPDCGKENSLYYIHKSNEYGDKTKVFKEKKCGCDVQLDNKSNCREW